MDMLDSLIEYVSAAGRVCPMPDKWNELWEILSGRQAVGAGREPPLPLILAAWSHSSVLDKQLRLKEHLEYAAVHGVLPEIDRFLRELPESAWAHVGRG
jgi:hypothetical protein